MVGLAFSLQLDVDTNMHHCVLFHDLRVVDPSASLVKKHVWVLNYLVNIGVAIGCNWTVKLNVDGCNARLPMS